MNDQASLDRQLDGALRKIIVAPDLPANFRQRLLAAIARSAPQDAAQRRHLLELERREQLAELRQDSVRLRLKTVGALIGGAFVAGVATTLAWPWINATFGAHAELALALLGTGIGLAIGVSTWLQRAGLLPSAR